MAESTRDLLIRLGLTGGPAVKRGLDDVAASERDVGKAAQQGAAGAGDASVKLVKATEQSAAATAKAERAAARAAAADARERRAQNQRLQDLGQSSALIGAALAAGFGLAATSAARFDKEMSGVEAVSGATAAEMGRLRSAAIEAGQATAFSATDAARAEAELTKAGISTADVLGGALRGSLDLAAAGQIGLADASTIAAQAMNIFKLGGGDVGHIADVLAAGANKSAADVAGLGDALKQGGLVAAQTGLSLEETVGGLSAFADGALTGSDAGTALKSMLQRLTPQSKEAAALMDQLGISAYDSGGNFIGLSKFAGNLQTSLQGLTNEQRNSALATIFGSDAVRGASILYEQGAEGIRRYVAQVNDQGAAGRMAATQMDNLAGDVEALKGSLETALIQSGSQANGVLRFMAQEAAGVVNAMGELPGPLQAAGVGLTGIGGAVLLALGGLGTLIPKVREARATLEGLGAAGHTANRGLSILGRVGGYAAGVVAVALAVDALSEGLNSWINGAANVDRMTQALADLSAANVPGGELTKQFGDDLDKLASKIKLTSAGAKPFAFLDNLSPLGLKVRDARKDIDAVDKSLAGIVAKGPEGRALAERLFGDLKAKAVAGGASVKQVNEAFGDYQNAIAGATADSKLAAQGIGGVGAAADGTAASIGGMTETAAEVSDWASSIASSISSALDPNKALSAAGDAITSAAETKAKARLDSAQKVLDDLGPPGRATEKVATFRSEIERLEGDLETLRSKGGAVPKQEALLASIEEQKQALAALPAEATEAARKGAEANVDAAKKALDEIPKNARVSLAEFSAELERSIKDVENWRGNLVELAKRGHGGLAKELAAMGPESASLVAEAVKGSDRELSKLEGLFAEKAGLAGDAAASELEGRLSGLSAIASVQGELTVSALAKAMGVAPDKVAAIVALVKDEIDKLPTERTFLLKAQLSVGITDESIAQIKTDLGQILAGIDPSVGTGRPGADRGTVGKYAEGGLLGATPRSGLQAHVARGPRTLYGEVETGGEAYLPLGMSKRSRSVPLLLQVADAFGYAVTPKPKDRPDHAFADGGILGATPGSTTERSVERHYEVQRIERLAQGLGFALVPSAPGTTSEAPPDVVSGSPVFHGPGHAWPASPSAAAVAPGHPQAVAFLVRIANRAGYDVVPAHPWSAAGSPVTAFAEGGLLGASSTSRSEVHRHSELTRATAVARSMGYAMVPAPGQDARDLAAEVFHRDTVLTGEPPSGGELHVSLGGSKREGSIQLVLGVARRYGYELVPAGHSTALDGRPQAPVGQAPVGHTPTPGVAFANGGILGQGVHESSIERSHELATIKRSHELATVERHAQRLGLVLVPSTSDNGVIAPRRHLPAQVLNQSTVLAGEPSTGGEAYLPLGESKRAGSLALLVKVAHRFGFDLVPGPAAAAGGTVPPPLHAMAPPHAMANGGILGAPASTAHWAAPQPGPAIYANDASGVDYDRLAVAMAAQVPRAIEQHNEHHFHGSEMPTEAALEYADRVSGWRLAQIIGS